MGLAHTQAVKLPPNIKTIWASPRDTAPQPLKRDTEALSNCEKLRTAVHFFSFRLIATMNFRRKTKQGSEDNRYLHLHF